MVNQTGSLWLHGAKTRCEVEGIEFLILFVSLGSLVPAFISMPF